MGAPGASLYGLSGAAGTPGEPGTVGPVGPMGPRGAAGQAALAPAEYSKWMQIVKYYTEVVAKMEQTASHHVRGVNREVSMLQQQSAIFKARSYAVNNGSVDLYHYMLAPRQLDIK